MNVNEAMDLFEQMDAETKEKAFKILIEKLLVENTDHD